jgi:hypothetical protein
MAGKVDCSSQLHRATAWNSASTIGDQPGLKYIIPKLQYQVKD